MAGGCWAGERMAAVILWQQRAGHAGLKLPAGQPRAYERSYPAPWPSVNCCPLGRLAGGGRQQQHGHEGQGLGGRRTLEVSRCAAGGTWVQGQRVKRADCAVVQMPASCHCIRLDGHSSAAGLHQAVHLLLHRPAHPNRRRWLRGARRAVRRAAP